MVKQILLVSIVRNVWRTVWRIYILVFGCKGLSCDKGSKCLIHPLLAWVPWIRNTKVLQARGRYLKNCHNFFYHFFPFFSCFALMHFIYLRSLPVSWGESRNTWMWWAGSHCFVLTSLASRNPSTKSGGFSLLKFPFYFIYFFLVKIKEKYFEIWKINL